MQMNKVIATCLSLSLAMLVATPVVATARSKSGVAKKTPASTAIKVSPAEGVKLKKFLQAVGTCVYKDARFWIANGYLRAEGWTRGSVDVNNLIKTCTPAKGMPKTKLVTTKLTEGVTVRWRKIPVSPAIEVQAGKQTLPCTLMISGKKFFLKKWKNYNKGDISRRKNPRAPSYIGRLLKAGFCRPYHPKSPPKNGLIYTIPPIKDPYNVYNTIFVGVYDLPADTRLIFR